MHLSMICGPLHIRVGLQARSLSMMPTTKLHLLLIFIMAATDAQAAYTNHTVGGPAGWFFNATTGTPSTDYAAWAKVLTFNLGDYLIFNTNTNQTVVQTYNETSYLNCSVADDNTGGDVSVYSGGEGFGVPATLAVPLTRVGPNYYFSDASDGEQCVKGMKFEITVGQGSGLPPYLNQPPPPPYVDPGVQTPPVGSGEVAPGGAGGGTENGGKKRGLGVGSAGLVALMCSLNFLI